MIASRSPASRRTRATASSVRELKGAPEIDERNVDGTLCFDQVVAAGEEELIVWRAIEERNEG